MATPAATWDDKGFQRALKQYLDFRTNVDPKKELRRRAKNVGIRLIAIYKKKGVNVDEITAKVKSLGKRVKIRPKIRAYSKTHKIIRRGKKKGQQGAIWTYEQMIEAETRARRSAKGFTTTGWFPAVSALGGNPRRKERAGTGPKRGTLVEKLSGSKKSETLINQQPGAAHVAGKCSSDMQQALDDETADMVNHIIDRQNKAAKRNGL